MIRCFAIAGFLSVMLFSGPAHPCGGGFGEQLEMDSSQTIIVRHRDGQETYLFNPRFCGAASEFGLILPIPGALAEEPALAEQEIYAALDDVSAPEIVIEEVCSPSPKSGGAMDTSGSGSNDGAGGVEVVDSGQVGIFDWVLLQADAVEAFTDWLDANQYPYEDAATAHFTHYVEQSWYFIAFKVTAGEEVPPEGSLLCGTFGPIRFAFAAEEPMVPARIAAVGEGAYHTFLWRLQVLSDSPMTASDTVEWEKLRYTGAVTAAQLADHPAMAAIAGEGDQFTSLDVRFDGSMMDEDIVLSPSGGATEYRETIVQTRYVDCKKKDGGCNVVAPGMFSEWLFWSLAIAFVILRRRRP